MARYTKVFSNEVIAEREILVYVFSTVGRNPTITFSLFFIGKISRNFSCAQVQRFARSKGLSGSKGLGGLKGLRWLGLSHSELLKIIFDVLIHLLPFVLHDESWVCQRNNLFKEMMLFVKSGNKFKILAFA